jgi:hypothetical protein
MLENIAVMLRGHNRTFKYTNKIIFDFFSKISNNVDYYYSTWLESSAFYSSAGSFNEQNLIAHVNTQRSEEYYSSWASPAYLSFRLVPYKHRREKSITYDAVFDTRPDVAPFLKKINLNNFIQKPRPNTIYTTGYEIQHNFHKNCRSIAVQDWFVMMDSKSYDVMAERFIHNNREGVQISWITYANLNNIHVAYLDWVDPIMVRPDMLYVDIDSPNLYEELQNKRYNWKQIDVNEKIRIMDETGVCAFDYMTESKTCSLY